MVFYVCVLVLIVGNVHLQVIHLAVFQWQEKSRQIKLVTRKLLNNKMCPKTPKWQNVDL